MKTRKVTSSGIIVELQDKTVTTIYGKHNICMTMFPNRAAAVKEFNKHRQSNSHIL
jgi:hypothetical protein